MDNLWVSKIWKQNKAEIHHELLPEKKVWSWSIQEFNSHKTLVIYVPSKNKAVILLSTKHHSNSIDKEKTINLNNNNKDLKWLNLSTYARTKHRILWKIFNMFNSIKLIKFNKIKIFSMFDSKFYSLIRRIFKFFA